ncbi:debranching enzyme 1 [Wolffia australiana]
MANSFAVCPGKISQRFSFSWRPPFLKQASEAKKKNSKFIKTGIFTGRNFGAIKEQRSERHGLRVVAAGLNVSEENHERRMNCYRFQTEGGGSVSVSVAEKQFTHTVSIEVSGLSLHFYEQNLSLSWQISRFGSLYDSHNNQLPLVQESDGRHTLDMEIETGELPTLLSFLIHSSFSGDEIAVRTAKKSSFRVPLGFSPGKTMPLGVSFCGEGRVNFALFSRSAERVTLCLYEKDHSNLPSLEIELDPYMNKTGDIWHASLESVANYVSYGYRCHGDLVHMDPYAVTIKKLTPGNHDLSFSSFVGGLQKSPYFDWTGDVRLRLPSEKLVVYRLNVGDFTGNFLGISEKMKYFKSLGINAVLLEPILYFDEKQGPYFPHNFFCPMDMYGPDVDAESSINSVKEMVKCLHMNGIEILLEVVFTHTADKSHGFQGIDKFSYCPESRDESSLNCNKVVVQKLIIDSLRHWVIDFHIDGFCFVNAAQLASLDGSIPQFSSRPSLIESISFDPVLSDTRFIADSWSPHDLSCHEFDFPHWGRWAEMNSKFCRDARNFLRGEGVLSDLATRLCGSGDMFSDSRSPAHSFNFFARNSGLSLVDLVSFSGEKLLQEFSWNCGMQGATSDPGVLETRLKQIRNFMFLLFVSLGVPVLNMGDECGLSNGGKTSLFDRSPFDWDCIETNFARQIMQFVAFLTSLRNRRSDIFQRKTFYKSENILWYGADYSEPKWQEPLSKFLALKLKAENDEELPCCEGDLFVAFNAFDVSSTAVLPEAPEDYKWFRLVDTSFEFPGFFSDYNDPDCLQYSQLQSYELKPHTCCLFEARVCS